MFLKNKEDSRKERKKGFKRELRAVPDLPAKGILVS